MHVISAAQMEARKKWLHDLRTTTEKQTIEMLGNSEIGFCCLGRAQVCLALDYSPSDGGLTPEASEMLGFSNCNPLVRHNERLMYATELNDLLHLSFKQIADVLEKYLCDPTYNGIHEFSI